MDAVPGGRVPDAPAVGVPAHGVQSEDPNWDDIQQGAGLAGRLWRDEPGHGGPPRGQQRQHGLRQHWYGGRLQAHQNHLQTGIGTQVVAETDLFAKEVFEHDVQMNHF